MNRVDNSQRVAAKVAGVSGLLAVVIVVFGNYALLNPLVVSGNAVETARNFSAHQTQVRLALICFLTYGVSVVVLLAALYVVLRPAGRLLALIGALFRLVFALLWLLTTLNLLGALRLVGQAPYLQAFEADRLQVAAFGVIASAWCVICAFVFLIFPSFDKTVNAYWFDSPMAIFELIVSFWLLFKGIVTPNHDDAADLGSRSTRSASPRLPVFL